MPNWVDNYLTVSKEAKKYIVNKEDEVDFEILIPMPEEIRNTTSPCEEDKYLMNKYGASNWYDWSVKNWGCKWNACENFIEEVGDDEIRLTFATPWAVPMAWLKKLAEMKIDFHLAWYEEQGYRGIITAEDGLIDSFELPEVKWAEDEDGCYISSEDSEPFDWRDMVYDGQFEEMMDNNDISIK